MKDDIPTCRMCGAPLYDKPQLWYDKRRKYCTACAEWRKRTQDAQRMKEQRVARRDERTKKILKLEQENFELKAKVDMLVKENNLLREVIINQRTGVK